MGGPRCHNCLYSVCDPELWLRLVWTGAPIVPRCANHPQWPGQLHDVPGASCRNYRPKPVLPQGDAVRLIPLGDGHYAYIDAADYERLSKHTWRLNNGYAARSHRGKWIFMHREIMQAPAGTVVDHFDANRVNNCRFNLRGGTEAEGRGRNTGAKGARAKASAAGWAVPTALLDCLMRATGDEGQVTKTNRRWTLMHAIDDSNIQPQSTRRTPRKRISFEIPEMRFDVRPLITE